MNEFLLLFTVKDQVNYLFFSVDTKSGILYTKAITDIHFLLGEIAILLLETTSVQTPAFFPEQNWPFLEKSSPAIN